MTMSRIILFALIASISFSCSDITQSDDDLSKIPCIDFKNSQGDDILCIKTINSSIIISNLTEQIIYYLVIEQETLTLIDPDPDYTTWLSIAGGETISMPYEDIIGYNESATKAWITWVLGDNEASDSATIEL